MSSRILTVVPGTPVEYESDTLLTVPASIMVNPNGGTVSVKTAIGGTYQAVADGNLAGDITDVKMDVLTGPVNAIPTGQGITDKSTLISRGWTVSTN